MSEQTLSRDRDGALLHAAIASIEEHGPAVGMRAIGERAGITRPNLYRYIDSRAKLDAAVVKWATADLWAHLEPETSRAGTTFEVARGVIGALVAWAVEHPNLYRFVVVHEQGQEILGVETWRSRFLADFVTATNRYLRGGSLDTQVPPSVVAAVLGLIDGGLNWWLEHRDETDESLVDRLSRQVSVLFQAFADEHGFRLSDDTLIVPGA